MYYNKPYVGSLLTARKSSHCVANMLTQYVALQEMRTKRPQQSYDQFYP